MGDLHSDALGIKRGEAPFRKNNSLSPLLKRRGIQGEGLPNRK